MRIPPRVPRSTGSRLARLAAFTLTLSLVVVAIPTLALIGMQAALGNDGTPVLTSRTNDPTANGYEAIVSPTPTMLVLGVSAKQQLASIALLAAASSGGAIVLVPTLTVTTGPRPRPLAQIYEVSGREGVVDALGAMFHLNFDTVIEADPTWFADAVTDAAPLLVDNSDDLLAPAVGDDEPVLLFPAGQLQLGPKGVSQFFEHRNVGEEERAALFRHELVWRAWLAAQARRRPGSASGSNMEAFQTFFVGLSAGPTQVLTLPVEPDEPLTRDDESELWYQTDREDLALFLATFVPFPAAASPGDRIKVRLLDGRGDRSLALGAAALLVPRGAEIGVFGNADRFDYARSVVEYYDVSRRGDAESLAAAMGSAEVILKEQVQESVDVTIIVGLDFSANPALR